MQLFVVVQVGVHFRGIVGIYDTKEQAVYYCDEYADNDDSPWHDWEVRPYIMNMNELMNGCRVSEPENIYTRKAKFTD